MYRFGWMVCWVFLAVLILCSFSAFSFQIMDHHPRPKKSALMSYRNIDDDNQAMNAIRSLADYHEGEWKGRARSFTVTPDIAAGIVQRKISTEYNVCVKLAPTVSKSAVSADNKGAIALSETISWEDKISHRSIALSPGGSCDLDVDDVDASYSLDSTHTLPTDFPTVLSGTNKVCSFVVEHCIAAGENRRCRCFAIYGVDESLIRVVVADEKRVQAENGYDHDHDAGTRKEGENNNNILTTKDVREMHNDVDRLVDKIAASMNELPTTSSIVSPQLEKNAESGGDNDNEKYSFSSNADNTSLDQLEEIMTASKKEDTRKLSLHRMSLLELCSGVWLGDMIIREKANVPASPNERGNKGFDRSLMSSSTSKSEKNVADWKMGVQKISWRFLWNFGEEISQKIDAGKVLGTALNDFMTKYLAGSVCVDESLSRRVPKDERMVYIDWAQQDFVGFLLGPYAVQVPRYANFCPTATTSRAAAVTKRFYTEFCVFQSAPSTTNENGDGIINVIEEELCCSKISRLYNFEGKLKQGCTSFYTFKRFEVDNDDDNDDHDHDQEI